MTVLRIEWKWKNKEIITKICMDSGTELKKKHCVEIIIFF